MLSFELTEEQQELKALTHRFARDVLRPVSAAYDRDSTFPRKELERAWELGLINSVVPEAYGGSGLKSVDVALIAEELGWGCSGFYASAGINDLATYPLLFAGTEEQKRRFLAPLSERFHVLAFALSEPSAGSDAAQIATRATRDGASYRLTGTKQWITNGGEADRYLVFARTDAGNAMGAQGLTAFVVEKGTPGFSAGRSEDKLGLRCSDTRALLLEECVVPEENRIGQEGAGFEIAMYALERSRVGIAAAATGLSRSALEHAKDYAWSRKAFGKPIAIHQAIQLMVADMDTDVSASRLLTWHAAWLFDQGKSASRESSIAKCFATDAALRITADAVQIFGASGYMKDYPVEKLFRDAKGSQIIEGTNQIHRLNIATRLYQE